MRVPCCERMGMKKGPWTAEEDQVLISYIQRYGHENWRALPKQAGLLRCGKSCRLRWTNYLRPDIKRGNFTKEEEETIIKLHQMIGNRWSAIATKLPGRTDNEIKNYWHTHLKKRVEEIPVVGSKRLIRCSSLQTSILGKNNNQRIVETWISNHQDFQNINDYYSLANQRIKEDHEVLQRSCSDGKSAGAQEICLTNKLSLESRAQILSTAGDQSNIVQSGDHDCINSDMVFWYNLFVNAGKSHEKVV